MALLSLKKSIIEEPTVESFIPYSHHCTDNIIKTHSGDYMAFIRFSGVAFESSVVEYINGWFEQFHGFLRNISAPNVAVHSHVLRVKSFGYPGGEFAEGFAKTLNDKYKESLSAKDLFENRLYLTLIYRPNVGGVGSAVSLFEKVAKAETEEDRRFCIASVNDMLEAAKTSLYAFSPKVLGVYEHNELLFSEPVEFLNYLVNNEWQRCAVPSMDMRRTLPTSRLFFGSGGTVISKCSTKEQFMTVIGMNEYPAPANNPDRVPRISPFIFNGLLRLPFELTLSQSFSFIPKNKAKMSIGFQQGRLRVSSDASIAQINAIDEAAAGIDGNEFFLGEHSLAILVKADNAKRLDENINRAGAELSDIGAKWMREDIACVGGLFAMLPGNFKYRINVSPITSMNFACFSSFHNFPGGRKVSQWGYPVSMVKTSSGGGYLFNFHDGDSEKIDPNHMEPASTLVVGKTGTGKTVLFGFLIAQLQKFRTADKRLTCVVFDKDMGTSVVVRAFGGNFYPLKLGIRSGFNPMQLEPTPRNIEFMTSLIKQLVRHESYPISPVEDKAIIEAVEGVVAIEKEHRNLTAVKEFLTGSTYGTGNGIADRLAKWCQGGVNGWLFDNPEDTLKVDCPILGFDVTEFLKNQEIKTATMMYLMHRVDSLMDGRRVPIFMDEFGILLDDGQGSDGVWAEFAEEGIVTVRKKDGFFVLAAQDPAQILRSKVSYALVNQTSTKIFLPNPNATEKDYIQGFGLTTKEYKIIKSLPERSRRFLIKQGHKSVVAELDLKGFDDELAVLSGNINTSALADSVISELGPNPDIWLPVFQERRKLL